LRFTAFKQRTTPELNGEAGLPYPNQAFFNLALALTRSVVSKPSLKDS
jgi:hypothetical protein